MHHVALHVNRTRFRVILEPYQVLKSSAAKSPRTVTLDSLHSLRPFCAYPVSILIREGEHLTQWLRWYHRVFATSRQHEGRKHA